MAELMESLEDWQAGRSLVDCHKFMLNNEINFDVTFLLGQNREPVRAHKYMLICRSSVFQSIFCGTIVCDGIDTIPVSDISAEIFRTLLLYMYCDEANIVTGNVNSLLYAAKKYGVKGLVDQCLEFLESSMCPNNVFDIIEQVHMYDGKDLEAKCFNFVFKNATTVLKSQSFENLCSGCVEQIVKSDELVVDEQLLYEAMLRWAEKKCVLGGMQISDENIRNALVPVLYYIRFPLMDTAYFTIKISTRKILSPEEVISIFQSHNGRTPPTNWQFNSDRRRGYTVFSVIRYRLIMMDDFPCHDQNHAINFTCDSPVLLHGAIVYGCLDESADYTTKTYVYNVTDKLMLCSKCLTLSTTREQHTYDIKFSKPVEVLPGKQYSVTVQMDGPPSKVGVHGTSTLSSAGVTFHFTNNPDSETSIDKGQIPGLLFTRLHNVKVNTTSR